VTSPHTADPVRKQNTGVRELHEEPREEERMMEFRKVEKDILNNGESAQGVESASQLRQKARFHRCNTFVTLRNTLIFPKKRFFGVIKRKEGFAVHTFSRPWASVVAASITATSFRSSTTHPS
jgi:hypothetical protein